MQNSQDLLSERDQINPQYTRKQDKQNSEVLSGDEFNKDAMSVLEMHTQNSSLEAAHFRRGRKAKYDGAEHPQLIDKAKLLLPEHNFDINKILSMDEFKPLIGSKDITRFVNKFILNRTTQLHSKSVRNVPLSEIQKIQKLGGAIKQSKPDLDGSIRSTEAIEAQFDPINSQSLFEFLHNLKTACSESLYEDMFRIIYEMNSSSGDNIHVKTRLFVSSLLYYNNEVIAIDEELLKSSMLLLAQRPNTEQALGLSNYIFLNEPECLARFQDEISKLDKNNIGIIPLMIGTFQQFKIDTQAVRLLPNTLLCLNKPFIQMLKEEQGLRLIRHVPIIVVGDFIQICALGSSTSYQKLDNFIRTMNEIFVQKWDFLDQEDFTLFMKQLSHELKIRNPLWVGKLDEISELAKNLSFIQQEKGVRNRRDIVYDCLKADFTSINQLLQIPNKANDLSDQEQRKIISIFRKVNNQDDRVEKFCQQFNIKAFGDTTLLKQLETQLGFAYLKIQKLCINFIQNTQADYRFINFGVGNGKTLLCSSLAIMHALQNEEPVFIIGKNEHLVLRDEKNFESLITRFNLNVNVNQFENKVGLYYFTQKSLESLIGQEGFEQAWKQSLVIIDEYDWILFDGNVKSMAKIIELFTRAKSIIGFTGSKISLKEAQCLHLAFKVREVQFPKLNSILGDKRIKLHQELIATNQAEYCKKIFEICQDYCKLTPVLIVAQTSYNMIENHFKKFSSIPFYSMKNIKGTKVEAQFDRQFISKNLEGQFGVFLLTEQQGRGTDLKTNHEIEFNGGLFLIVADVFSIRSMDQIIGRVGRLQRKGTYKLMIYKQGSKETIDQVVSLQQQIIENQNHVRLAELQQTLANRKEQNDQICQEQQEVGLEQTQCQKTPAKIIQPKQEDDGQLKAEECEESNCRAIEHSQSENESQSIINKEQQHPTVSLTLENFDSKETIDAFLVEQSLIDRLQKRKNSRKSLSAQRLLTEIEDEASFKMKQNGGRSIQCTPKKRDIKLNYKTQAGCVEKVDLAPGNQMKQCLKENLIYKQQEKKKFKIPSVNNLRKRTHSEKQAMDDVQSLN